MRTTRPLDDVVGGYAFTAEGISQAVTTNAAQAPTLVQQLMKDAGSVFGTLFGGNIAGLISGFNAQHGPNAFQAQFSNGVPPTTDGLHAALQTAFNGFGTMGGAGLWKP
jgi:hypothetical protein